MTTVITGVPPESYDVSLSPWGAQTGLSPSDPTANIEAINDCMVQAKARERNVYVPDKVGVNGSVWHQAGVILKGGTRVVRKPTLTDCTGSWLFFSGTVPAKTPLLKIGDADQTEQFDNPSVENLGLWGADTPASQGISIRSNGLLATPTYRTKGIVLRQVVVSNFNFGIDIGPNPTTSTFATSTAYVANQFVTPIAANGRVYRCVAPGTSAGSSPTWPTSTGTTVTSGTATFMDWGLTESGRAEEQSDDILIDRLDVWGTSSMYVGMTVNGSNAGDAMSVRNFQFFVASTASNPAIDLINGGSFHFVNGYASGNTNSDFVRVWTPGQVILDDMQCESMGYFLVKPSQSSTYETDMITVRNCIFDDDVRIDGYCRINGSDNTWKATSTLYLNGAQWNGRNELWRDTGRYSYPLTTAGVGCYTNDRFPKAGVGWLIAGEKIQRRVPTSGTPLYDVVTVGGLQAVARANSTAYALNDIRMNAATTYAFRCTTAGTSAGAEPGGMALPTIGLTYTDGSVVWTCIAVTPTTKTGMTLS